MRSIRFLILLSLCPFIYAAEKPQSAEPDQYRGVLEARANRPAQPAGRSVFPDAGPGAELFHMYAPDNAVCIRAVADVTGDGLDEVVVGIDESQVDNVFCLDGSSSGVATVVWKIQTTDGVSGGAPYGDQCIVPVSDSDGNGDQNVLVGTAWGGRTAYDLDCQAGATVWKYDTYLTANSGWVYSLCELSDVTGDGVPDSAFGAGSYFDSVCMVDGSNTGGQAAVIWQFVANDAIYSVRNIGDVNGDGKDDVLAAAGDNVDRIYCLDGATTNPGGSIIWQYAPGTSVYACGVLPDITGDGIDEAIAVLWTMDGSAIRCLSGADGAPVWSSTEVSDYGMMVDVLEDISGDGYPELIVSSWENAVIVIDGKEGGLIWKTEVGTVNGGDVWTARAIDDLNRDGRQDVIAGSFDYHVYAMDGDTGEVFWAFNTNNRIYSVAPVGDLDGDGRPEVGVGTQDTNNNKLVYVLDGDADIPFPNCTLSGSGDLGTPLDIEITGIANWYVITGASQATANTPMPPYIGNLGLGVPITRLPNGRVPASGVYDLTVMIPNDPGLSGKTFYIQSLVHWPTPTYGGFSDVESITLN